MKFATSIPGYSLSLELSFDLLASYGPGDGDVEIETISGELRSEDGALLACVVWEQGDERARLADADVERLSAEACDELEARLDELTAEILADVREARDAAAWDDEDAALYTIVDAYIDERREAGYR